MVYVIYPFILISIFLIKDEYFKVLRVKFSCLRDNFKPLYRDGESLYESILDLEVKRQLDDSLHYKFFQSLMKKLLYAGKEYGAEIGRSLLEIKKGISTDIKFEKRMSKCVSSAILNFIFASLITWFFTYLLEQSIELEIPYSNYLVIAVWQVIGFIFFWILLKSLKKRFISPLETYFSIIYLVSIYLDTNLSLNDAIAKSNLKELAKIKIKGLDFYKSKLIKLIKARMTYGAEIGPELKILINESWIFYEDALSKTLDRITILKFITLCLFFFSSYLGIVFLLLEQVI